MRTYANKFLILLFCLVSSFCMAITVENPRADLYVSPGSITHTKFNVRNDSSKAQKIDISVADYFFKADGTNEFSPPGTKERSNATWLSYSPENFIIPPGTNVEIIVNVRVPDRPMIGTYWSILLVEYSDPVPERETSRPEEELTSTIRVVRRQGIQIRSHFSGTGEMKARFFNKNLEKKSGKTFFSVDLENTGTLFYRGDFWIELFNQEGYPMGKLESPSRSVYPGCSVRFSTDVSHLKKGKYTALCVYDTRSNKVFGGKYQLEID